MRVRLLGERPGRVPRHERRLGHRRRALPAPARLAGARAQRRGRIPLHLSRLEVRRRRHCVDMPTEPRATASPIAFGSRLSGARSRRAGLGVPRPARARAAFPAFDWTKQPRNQIALREVLARHQLPAGGRRLDRLRAFVVSCIAAPSRDEEKRATLSHATCRRDSKPRTPPTASATPRCASPTSIPTSSRREDDALSSSRPTARHRRARSSRNAAALVQIFVPIDDTHTMHYSMCHSQNGTAARRAAPARALPHASRASISTRMAPACEAENWYKQDRAAMKNGS